MQSSSGSTCKQACFYFTVTNKLSKQILLDKIKFYLNKKVNLNIRKTSLNLNLNFCLVRLVKF